MVAAIALFRFIGEIGHVLTIIFISFFLALALNPVVSWVSRRLRVKSRVRATAAAYLAVVAIIIGFFALITPPLISETRDFVKDVPQIVADFQKKDSGVARLIDRYNLNEQLSETANNLSSRYSDFGATILEAGRRVFTVLVSILAVIVLTFMMLVEGPRWLNSLWSITPANNRERYQRVARKMYKAVTGFALGQLILAAAGGLFTLIALMVGNSIFDASVNAVALAGIVAILSLIPLFGTILSAAIVVLISALDSPAFGITMLVYYIVYQQIENHTFQPYVQSKVTQLTPMLVFISALIGIGFAGLLGAILAIPTAGALKVLLEDQMESRGIRTSSGRSESKA